jgi:superfamily II DNA or RNA helicase
VARISVELTNHWASVDCGRGLRLALEDAWSFALPAARFSSAFRSGTWDGRIRFFKNCFLPSGLFRATYREIEQKLGISFAIEYVLSTERPKRYTVALSEDEKYRYQEECIVAMVNAFHRGGGVILSATGTGKTAIGGKFFKHLSGYNCLFVNDQLDLLNQSQEELAKWLGEEVGYVGDSRYEPKRVTVATIQTLHKHIRDPKFLKWYKQIQVVIVDELHEQMARRNFKVLTKINPVARYGLTATLQLKKKPVRIRAYAFAGPVLFEFPITEGVEKGVLSKGRVLQLCFPEAEDGDLIHYANPADEYSGKIVEDEQKISACRMIVKHLLSEDRHVFLLAERIAHVESLSQAMKAIPHRLAYGPIKVSDRQESQKEFEQDEIRLLIASKVFRKGVNVKRVDAIIDLAELPNKNAAIQKFGRGVRLHPVKDELLYIDFGTQGSGRFGKAAKSRARAFRAEGIPFRSVKVSSAKQALEAASKELQRMRKCRELTSRQPRQRELPLRLSKADSSG